MLDNGFSSHNPDVRHSEKRRTDPRFDAHLEQLAAQIMPRAQ